MYFNIAVVLKLKRGRFPKASDYCFYIIDKLLILSKRIDTSGPKITPIKITTVFNLRYMNLQYSSFTNRLKLKFCVMEIIIFNNCFIDKNLLN